MSKCDEEYLQCVSTCSSTDCLMECNRAWAICGDCKYIFEDSVLKSIRFISFIQLVHVILIVLMVAKDATTQFASAMWVRVSTNFYLFVFKDDSNDDNLDACLNKTSRNLGQCILDCNDDTSCETACVSAFKSEHSECPCQVCETDHNVFW